MSISLDSFWIMGRVAKSCLCRIAHSTVFFAVGAREHLRTLGTRSPNHFLGISDFPIRFEATQALL
jgi:hypothetical protein